MIHLSFVHSKSLEERSLTKFLSKLSLKDISIRFFSNLTKFTFFSSSYFNFNSLFFEQIPIKSLSDLIENFSSDLISV